MYWYSCSKIKSISTVVLKQTQMEQAPDPQDEGKMMDKSIGQMKDSYRTVDEKLKLRKEDPLYLLVGKVLLRILLIIVMIALSPFLIIGLIFAFMAAL